MSYKKILQLLLFPILMVLLSMCTPKKDLSNKLQNPYFAQVPPGDTAEIFAEDIISVKGRFEFAVSFSPNGKEILIGTELGDTASIIYTKENSDGWTKPKRISLSKGKFVSEMEAFFTPDGKHIYFAPFNKGLDVRLWSVDITPEGWENPRLLDSVINTAPVFYPVCASNMSLYYRNILERKIYKSVFKSGKYETTEEVEIANAGHCFIAPDESFALIDSRHESIGKGDIFVVFKNAEGQWLDPINLGLRVNSVYSESCPSLSHDGKYIFFSRYNDINEMSDIYWVDAKIIEELKPENL